MIAGFDRKYVNVIKQESVTNGATLTSDNIDLKGYDSCIISVLATSVSGATNNPSTLKLQDSDTTAATDFADITAFVGDGTGGFTIPNSATATTDKALALFKLDTRYRKRYLRSLITPVISTNAPTTQNYSVFAELGRASESPVGTTEENVAVVVTG